MKKLIVAGDFHIPYHDPLLLDLFIKFLKDFKPDIFVINGDFLDCWAISKFQKVPNVALSLKDELEVGKKILKKIRATLPKAEIYYICGNHDWRIKQYTLYNAPEFYQLLVLEDLLELRELNIEFVDTKNGASRWIDTYKRFGQLYVGHFDKVNKHSAMTAKGLVEDKGISLIQNHVHRGGVFHKRLIDGRQLVGIENFCMCDLNPNYMSNVNWTQGWTIAYVNLESGRFHAYPIPVINYKFYWNEKVYKI